MEILSIPLVDDIFNKAVDQLVMDYRHFHELLAGKAGTKRVLLQELLRDHRIAEVMLLPVKVFHDQQHIRYEPAQNSRRASAGPSGTTGSYNDQVQASSDSVFREPVTAP